MIYPWIVENKEIIKIFYGLVIALMCLIIVVKTNRLFHLSFHQGIRYFRNAFFFYGLAFITRYIFGANYFVMYLGPDYLTLVTLIFEFFLVTGGFFLLYSLLWKRFEGIGNNYFSSLLNPNILLFYFMSIIIVLLDCLWGVYYFMFLSQIAIFGYASVISYKNYEKKGFERKFLKFYFLAMILSFSAWVLNSIAALLFNWNLVIVISVYILNIGIFLLFLYGVVKLSGK